MWTKLEFEVLETNDDFSYQPQGVIGCNHIACCSDLLNKSIRNTQEQIWVFLILLFNLLQFKIRKVACNMNLNVNGK